MASKKKSAHETILQSKLDGLNERYDFLVSRQQSIRDAHDACLAHNATLVAKVSAQKIELDALRVKIAEFKTKSERMG